MATYARKLMDANGDYVAPKTWATCVYMTGNTTVQNRIDSIDTSITNIINGTLNVGRANKLNANGYTLTAEWSVGNSGAITLNVNDVKNRPVEKALNATTIGDNIVPQYAGSISATNWLWAVEGSTKSMRTISPDNVTVGQAVRADCTNSGGNAIRQFWSPDYAPGAIAFSVDTTKNLPVAKALESNKSQKADGCGDTFVFGRGGYIQNNTGGSLIFSANGVGVGNNVRTCLTNFNTNDWFYAPYGNGEVGLGSTYHRWGQIYSVSPSINTSDRNQKNTIAELDEKRTLDFIKGQKPVSYKFNTGTSNRTHWGMISQDEEDLLTELGMTPLDFAGFCKDQKAKTVTVTEDQTDPVTKEVTQVTIYKDVPIPGEYIYSLRYEEFIAPLIKTVQVLLREVDTLKTEVASLKTPKV